MNNKPKTETGGRKSRLERSSKFVEREPHNSLLELKVPSMETDRLMKSSFALVTICKIFPDLLNSGIWSSI